MKIQSKITLSKKDVKEIISNYLIREGYNITGEITYNMSLQKTRCGYEFIYEPDFDGITINVEK